MVNTQSKQSLIADRYADALIEMVGAGKLSYEKIYDDLKVIQDTLDGSGDLDEFLKSPLISNEDKKEVIIRVFSQNIDDLMVNFLKVVVDKSRFAIFREIFRSYQKALDKINNLSRVKVTSAIELSNEVKERLKNKLEEKMHKSVALDWDVEPGIIAGLVIRMGDNVIDTSLKNKLEDLSKNIIR